MTSPAEAVLVDGLDVDAVAAAVRGCPAVDDLDGGRLGSVATYLPGRRVPGIRIEDNRIEVHVRGVWGQPVGLIAQQIRGVLATLSGGRVIDVVLTDVADPGQAKAPLASPTTGAVGAATPSVLADGTVEAWTSVNASDAPSGGSSSGPTIQTEAETRPNS
ncbi:MAG TPA: hypothetical protein VGB75_00880 [Jatrophihabitans sp.]|jgi:hypothetical protein|uniref:hypothetical protein n=1 Tax=Jatrophihabitans sp. TaxID=1932789 RepID=UPI002EE692A6